MMENGMALAGPPAAPQKAAHKAARNPLFASAAIMALGLAACTHTVKLEAPKEPIRIDLNVKIEQEVVVRLEREVQQLIQQNPNIF
jgi:hypothetical protein